ncbi:3-ketoacyl-ACP reductase [Mucilaginibacter jinjuensis]|uniref:3-ketoacyl-ACP reductase n=1 Tax=Mucilaginibacter jinjuensis TaxID=1176721 RepID=A0ABY7TE96_9SPHI|nr:3-ketoacyl-ACP reductase [Mucilaginibacter jinjuensis]WCT14791.1 3-ketoacyl-ACP reductase [Mucilaginibacter jinjuensis]
METLTGKTALITGAGKGIGKALAIALAKEGVNVGLIARSESDLQKVATEVEALGVKAFIATADVGNLEQVNAAVDKIKAGLGFIDILINNAGVGVFGGFMELDPARWEEIIRINLLGAYYVTRAVLPAMIDKKSGDIVNIASTAGQRGAAVTSAYSASKFGLIGMSESLMQEVRKHNIRVSTLTPSTIATDMAIDLKLTDGNPDKVMQAEDFAEFIVHNLKLNRRVFVKEAGLWSTNP